MFCNYCRAFNPDDAIYCSACGRTIKVSLQSKSEEPKAAAVGLPLTDKLATALPAIPSIVAKPEVEEATIPQRDSKSHSGIETSPPKYPSQIGSQAVIAESVGQPEERADVKAAVHTDEEDMRRRRWASCLLLANGVLWLSFLLVGIIEGFPYPSEIISTGSQIWNLIVAIGLIRGGDGWRAFACFRVGFGLLVGFYLASGMGEGPSSPYYAWFNAAWCIGFLVLLWGKKASSRRRVVGTLFVAVGQLALLAVSLFAIIPELRLRSTIQSYSLPTKTVSDQDLGYAITVPNGWSVLKQDNPVLNLPDAKMVAVNLRSGAFAAFLAELPTAGLRSPDNYIDQVEKRIKDRPSTHFRELRRSDILMDGSAWRKAEVEWQESGEELSGVFLVVRRGWLFYSLRGWSGKAFKSGAEESLLDLQRAVTISPEEPNEKFTVGFIKGLQTRNPLISERAAKQLIEAASTRSYTVEEISQLIDTAVEKGRPGLTTAEQNELDALYLRAFATLSDAERRNLSSYSNKLNAGQQVDSSEAQAADKLILKGVRNLPESVQGQFRIIFSKMVESGLTRLE